MDATILGRNRVTVIGGTFVVEGRQDTLVVGIEPREIGRNAGCDLVLDDGLVSAAHVRVVATDRGVNVKDLGSTNGTFVDGTRVESAFLAKPVELRLGDTKLRFEPAAPERVRVGGDRFGRLTGSTASMRSLFEHLRKASRTDLNILVLGETGTGKELVAHTIHEESSRSKGPFVVVDCTSIAPSLAESLLFGHEKGAFTGAVDRRSSPFLEANGGTLFLDEVGELPSEVQPKLLRALQEREVKPVGSNAYRPFDARVVAATHRDLMREMNGNGFRSDLFFRIAQVRVELPPLRERRDDIVVLIQRMTKDLAERKGTADAFARISLASLEGLAREYDWPGNVRELSNLVQVAIEFEPDGEIDLAKHLRAHQASAPKRAADERWMHGVPYTEAKREALDRFQRAYFSELVVACGGNLSEVTRRSELSRPQVYEIVRRHGLGAPPSDDDGRGERKARGAPSRR